MNILTTADELNDCVWATLKPSPIHGVGVFAIKDIPKGTYYKAASHSLFKLNLEQWNKIYSEIKRLILQRHSYPNDFPFPSPNDDVDLQAFMNHSNTPNTNGAMTLQDIKCGEELTEDYRIIAPNRTLESFLEL